MRAKIGRLEVLTIIGMAAVIVGAVLYEASVHDGWWAVLVGGLVLFFVRLRTHMQGKDDKGERPGGGRVSAILLFSSAMICVSAYLMMSLKGYWLLPLMIAAATELYASLRMK